MIFVTLPRPLDSVALLTTEQAQRDLALVKNELARLKEFWAVVTETQWMPTILYGTSKKHITLLTNQRRVNLNMEEIKMNEKAVERLKRKIILQENQNLKTRTMTDQQMVAWIKKQIEEEAQCYSNQ
mgnify:CR=1 FL=1